MARASTSRGKRSRSNARARGQQEQRVAPATPQKRSGSYEDQLFFSRLRRKTKWVFALLAGAFAIGFLAFGVGTGVNGTSLGDVFRDVFGGDGSGISVEDAQKKVDESPNDPAALLALATALQENARATEAIDVLERYAKLQPDDADALRQLAALYEIQATDARQRATDLSLEVQAGSITAGIFSFPGTSGFLGAIGQDPVDQALSTALAVKANEARDEARVYYKGVVPVYERLAALTPDEPILYIQLGQAADAAGDTEKAIEAYEKYLELAGSDDPNAEFVRSQLQQLGDTVDVVTG